MTRTFILEGGEKMAEKRKIYDVVLRAQKAAIAALGAGKKAREIDNSARYVIKQAGYGAYFVHGTGHGAGLEVHEAPGISGRSAEVLGEGMLFTVEPGIYVPGLGGVRIEDMVFLRAGGAEVLTRLPKSLKKSTIGGDS
jgi:Xaa-Pro aminopeptidase